MKSARFFLFALVALSADAQRDFSNVEIKTIPVAEGIYMLEGWGGISGCLLGRTTYY